MKIDGLLNPDKIPKEIECPNCGRFISNFPYCDIMIVENKKCCSFCYEEVKP